MVYSVQSNQRDLNLSTCEGRFDMGGRGWWEKVGMKCRSKCTILVRRRPQGVGPRISMLFEETILSLSLDE
jgi:hypothetical protein